MDERVLLTEDKDFGELVIRQNRAASGVVFLRIEPGNAQEAWLRLRQAIARFGAQLYVRYTVIEAARMRSRLLR